MALIYCSACGDQMSAEAPMCPKCGHPNKSLIATYQPKKSRVTAGVLALLVGGLGIHKFYLGKVGLGLVYILFVWTLIPAIIALIEGILYLTQDDEIFGEKQGVRV